MKKILLTTVAFAALSLGQAYAQSTSIIAPVSPTPATPTPATALDLSAETGLAAGTAGGNASYIEQVGTANSASVFQYYGDAGTAVIEQEGSNLLADVYQDDTNSGDAQDNRARIIQDGLSSSAYISQYHDGNGDDNIAVIEQEGVDYDSIGNSASIVQSGNDNQAKIRQDDVWYANSAIVQVGTGNSAYNLQYWPSADYADSSIVQWGTDNVAEVYQYGYNAWSNVYQNGTANNAFVVQ